MLGPNLVPPGTFCVNFAIVLKARNLHRSHTATMTNDEISEAFGFMSHGQCEKVVKCFLRIADMNDMYLGQALFAIRDDLGRTMTTATQSLSAAPALSPSKPTATPRPRALPGSARGSNSTSAWPTRLIASWLKTSKSSGCPKIGHSKLLWTPAKLGRY